ATYVIDGNHIDFRVDVRNATGFHASPNEVGNRIIWVNSASSCRPRDKAWSINGDRDASGSCYSDHLLGYPLALRITRRKALPILEKLRLGNRRTIGGWKNRESRDEVHGLHSATTCNPQYLLGSQDIGRFQNIVWVDEIHHRPVVINDVYDFGQFIKLLLREAEPRF